MTDSEILDALAERFIERARREVFDPMADLCKKDLQNKRALNDERLEDDANARKIAEFFAPRPGDTTLSGKESQKLAELRAKRDEYAAEERDLTSEGAMIHQSAIASEDSWEQSLRSAWAEMMRDAARIIRKPGPVTDGFIAQLNELLRHEVRRLNGCGWLNLIPAVVAELLGATDILTPDEQEREDIGNYNWRQAKEDELGPRADEPIAMLAALDDIASDAGPIVSVPQRRSQRVAAGSVRNGDTASASGDSPSRASFVRSAAVEIRANFAEFGDSIRDSARSALGDLASKEFDVFTDNVSRSIASGHLVMSGFGTAAKEVAVITVKSIGSRATAKGAFEVSESISSLARGHGEAAAEHAGAAAAFFSLAASAGAASGALSQGGQASKKNDAPRPKNPQGSTSSGSSKVVQQITVIGSPSHADVGAAKAKTAA